MNLKSASKQLNTETYKYQVSVIVPCYNTKPWLDECLESIVNQTLKNIEIICINDGSTDGTGARLDEWQIKYPDKIKVIHQQNGGLSNARNAGMDIAQGECIGFVDSDDFIDVTMYEKLYKVLKDHNADMVKTNFLSFIDGEYIKLKTNNFSFKEVKALPEDYNNSLFYWGCFFTCGYLHKKIFLDNNNIKFKTDIRYMEDYVFSYDIVVCNPKVFKIEENFYFYRGQRQGQLTSSTGKELFDVFKVFNYIYKINKQNTNIKLVKKINDILFKHKMELWYFIIRIKREHKIDFFYKYSYFLFNHEKIIDIYKYLFYKKRKNFINYILAPGYLLCLHFCYLLQKYFIKNIKKHLPSNQINY